MHTALPVGGFMKIELTIDSKKELPHCDVPELENAP